MDHPEDFYEGANILQDYLLVVLETQKNQKKKTDTFSEKKSKYKANNSSKYLFSEFFSSISVNQFLLWELETAGGIL